MAKVAFIGLGVMGYPMAGYLQKAGHDVTVFEAQPDPGGQVRLTAQNPRRAEMISIIARPSAVAR